MKLGIYVGSFNPVHKGHIKIVNHLLDNNYLDKIIIIPTGNYWNKQDIININDRINMLKFYENDKIIIDTNLNDISYTYQIMDILSKEYNDYELNLIIGADNIIDFDKWKNYKKITDYNIVIINRENINIMEYINKYDINKYIIINDLPILNISSTMIRNMIKNNQLENISNYIDKEVINYINNKNIYSE